MSRDKWAITHVPTNRWIADRMDYSIAGVSLLRSGNRHPTIETMEAVERAIGWPMCDQVNVRGEDYADAFNKMMLAKFEEEKEKIA